MSFLDFLGPAGFGVAFLSFAGLGLKVYAWRARARDMREYARSLLEAKTEAERQALVSSPPPELPDVLTKVLALLLISGLSLGALPVAFRVAEAEEGQGLITRGPRDPAVRCVPKCGLGQRCVGQSCQANAKPDSDPAPLPDDRGSETASTRENRVGPQSSSFATTSDWTDGVDPFERDPDRYP